MLSPLLSSCLGLPDHHARGASPLLPDSTSHLPFGDAADLERRAFTCAQKEPNELPTWPANYPVGEWRITLGRHGESVNNIVSQGGLGGVARYRLEGGEVHDRGITRFPGAEPGGSKFYDGIKTLVNNCPARRVDHGHGPANSINPGLGNSYECARDTFLSPTGETVTLDVMQALFWDAAGGAWADNFHLFDEYRSVYTSPLRRTLSTAALLLGVAYDAHFQAALGGGNGAAGERVTFKLAPWIHEELKSISDVSSDSAVTLGFVTAYQANEPNGDTLTWGPASGRPAPANEWLGAVPAAGVGGVPAHAHYFTEQVSVSLAATLPAVGGADTDWPKRRVPDNAAGHAAMQGGVEPSPVGCGVGNPCSRLRYYPHENNGNLREKEKNAFDCRVANIEEWITRSLDPFDAQALADAQQDLADAQQDLAAAQQALAAAAQTLDDANDEHAAAVRDSTTRSLVLRRAADARQAARADHIAAVQWHDAAVAALPVAEQAARRRAQAGHHIFVTHSAVIRRLFAPLIGNRKPANTALFTATLVSDGNGKIPYWKDIGPFRTAWTDARYDANQEVATYVAPVVVGPAVPPRYEFRPNIPDVPRFLNDADKSKAHLLSECKRTFTGLKCKEIWADHHVRTVWCARGGDCAQPMTVEKCPLDGRRSFIHKCKTKMLAVLQARGWVIKTGAGVLTPPDAAHPNYLQGATVDHTTVELIDIRQALGVQYHLGAQVNREPHPPNHAGWVAMAGPLAGGVQPMAARVALPNGKQLYFAFHYPHGILHRDDIAAMWAKRRNFVNALYHNQGTDLPGLDSVDANGASDTYYTAEDFGQASP